MGADLGRRAMPPADGLTVTWRMTGSLAASERAVWGSLIPRFPAELPHPEHVELVVTDQYEAVAGEYAVRSPVRANPDETAADYRAAKPDGAAAAARTVDLPEGEVAVIATAAMAKLGQERTWRLLLHEAQHVRLHQAGDGAWGVHRRAADFELPDDLSYTFVWLAEMVIDEFRCELAVHEAGVPLLGMGSDPADYDDIVAAFGHVRHEWHRTQDVLAAFQHATTVLQRLDQFLAYGAAQIVFEPTERAAWSSIPSMESLLRVVSRIPSATSLAGDDQLATYSVEAARMLRQTLRGMGFDIYNLEDGSLYFEVLW
jgi:hypothetical protein